jgi:twitching motility protein PilT
MRRPELDYILGAMLDSQPEVSDLLFTVDKPLQVESIGELKPVNFEPPLEKLTPFQTEMVALNLIGDNRWHIGDLLKRGSCDTAYTLADKARFRISIFSQRGNYSIVLRKLNTIIPTLEWLKFPDIIKRVPEEKTGLVLVTGATGSGKSTTWGRCLRISITPSRSILSPWRIPSNSSISTTKPLSINANWGPILTLFPMAYGPPCARRPKSCWSAKCATARRSRLL